MLATQRALETTGGRPEGLIEAARRANPHLAGWLGQTEAVAGTLMAISQIPFAAKEQVVNDIFMVGDSAGLPAPFLGLGVATGLCSAIKCSEVISGWLHGRDGFEAARLSYESWWRAQFASTHKWGHRISQLLCRPVAGEFALQALHWFPSIGETIYRRSRAASGSNQEFARVER
jgi:flavin-dependent dehydrogenase